MSSLPPRPGDLALAQPSSLAELLELRSAHRDWLLLAGGTDLMVQLMHGLVNPPGVIDLCTVPELRGLEIEDRTVRIGAGVTFAELLEDPDLLAGWPLLVEAAETVGAVQIRNRATLGGNLVNASPSGDSLPPLVAYGASLRLASVRGSRDLPIEDFYRGYKDLDLAPDEVLVSVELRRPAPGTVQRFRKIGTRKAQSISKLSLALLLARDAQTGALREVRLACGAVGPIVARAKATEALLEGALPSPELAAQASRSLQDEISPIDDIRSSEAYRRSAAGRALARFLLELI